MNFLNNNKEKKQVYVLQLMIGINSVGIRQSCYLP